jgi:deoxycytidylate deaminase
MTPPSNVIDAAILAASKSPCQSKRGVVVFDEVDRILVTGWNHQPKFFECDGSDRCKSDCRQTAIHAEQDAIMRRSHSWHGHDAEMVHVKIVGGTLVPSGQPDCVQCSKLIMESGIVAMWLFHETGWRRYAPTVFHALSLTGERKRIEGTTE